jgi:hypothetical protein
MIDPKQLRDHVIIPCLKSAGLYCHSAVMLLLGTAAIESAMGLYLKQKGNGPAKGIYQMEPGTHNDIVINYLFYKPQLAMKVLGAIYQCDISKLSTTDVAFTHLYNDNNLIGNLNYATLMTRVHYLRVAESLPASNDVAGLARYWKRYYNSPLGKGSEQQFIDSFKIFAIESLR